MSGIVDFSQIGDSNQPSPSIWGDCPNTLLRDKGLGYFVHAEFLGNPDTIAATAATAIEPGLNIDCDTDTVLAHKAAEVGGYLDIETDGDDNDAAAIFTEPLGTITKNSGKKFWFEARVELGAITDQGVFVGIVEEAGASRDVVADNAGSNGVITESLIGFLCDNGDTNAYDAIYRKDAGTVVNVLNDVTNATAIPLASRASLLADVEYKLGIYFNGRDQLSYFVNGYKVATVTVDSTIDQAKNYCGIVCVKTGTGAAVSIASDFVRVGAQHRT